MMKQLHLMSLFFMTILQASLTFAATEPWGQGEVLDCQLRQVSTISTNQQIKVEVARSFSFYASAKSSGVSRVIFRIPPCDAKAPPSSYAIQLMASLEGADKGWIRGSVASFDSGHTSVMVNQTPLSMVFHVDDVQGQVLCERSAHRYAFINMETRLETDISAIPVVDSVTVATVPALDHMLLQQGFIETVNGGGASNIGKAFVADRTCLMGSAVEAMAALRASAAFESKDTLVLRPNGLEFQVDQIVGCLQLAIDTDGSEICKVPKFKKNGKLIRVPLCE